MKVKFSKTCVFIPDWKGNLQLPVGEQVNVDLNVLEFVDLLTIMDAFSKVDASGNVNTSELIKGAASILPKYVVINHLEDDDGPVGIEQALRYPRFMDLIGLIIGKLVEISTPMERDEKNSDPQPGS